MELHEWIEREGRGAMTELHHRTRLAVGTLMAAVKDGAKTRRVAESISEATGGEVSVATLLGIETPAPDTTAGA